MSNEDIDCRDENEYKSNPNCDCGDDDCEDCAKSDFSQYKGSQLKFAKEVSSKGFKVNHYRGRFSYEGPSVHCDEDELQDVIRATEVYVQWDSMGRGYVVYPGYRSGIR